MQFVFYAIGIWMKLKKQFETDSLTIFEWFQIKYIKANGATSQIVLTTHGILKINIGGSLMRQYLNKFK